MTEEERIRRADQARQITANETYREAWSSLEKNLRTAWEQTKPMQTEEREKLWRSLKTLREVKLKLESFIADGNEAAREIQRKKTRAIGPRT